MAVAILDPDRRMCCSFPLAVAGKVALASLWPPLQSDLAVASPVNGHEGPCTFKVFPKCGSMVGIDVLQGVTHPVTRTRPAAAERSHHI